MKNTLAALASFGPVIAATVAGGRHGPQSPVNGIWYASLRKPSYTPPGPAFGAAWTVLDGLLATAGYRLMKAPSSPARSLALAGWGLSTAGLAGYPWVFFGRKKLDASLAVTGAMLLAAGGTVAAAREVDRPAAAMGVPLVLWLGFATLLSEEIWRRN
ncbi:MAG: TspO/MBR family protein [Janthinobacterium lividum]